MQLGTKAKIAIAGGLIFAAVFLTLGVRELTREDDTAQAQPVLAVSTASAVVARAGRAIAVGETISGDMIVNAAFDPARHQTIATPAEIIGKVATQPIAEGAMIPRNGVDIESNLAMRVPIGERAVSIDTNAEIAVAGLVRPGDMVDVQVVYPGMDAISGARSTGRSRTETVLQRIQVLAVGEVVLGTEGEGTGMASAPAPARTVTLALTPEEVAALSLAKSTGTILLSLRNPQDTGDVEVPPMVASGNAPAASVPAIAPVARPVTRRAAAAPQRTRTAPSQPSSHQVDLVIGGRQQVLTSESSR